MLNLVERTESHDSIQRDQRETKGDNSSLTLYLREIGKVKLLSPQEEIELAARIKKGDKEAREQMIKANLRLVVKIARDYENIGVPLLDLISEGNIGLMKAVERFDPAKGAKLSTYSAWWIKQAIKRALANQSKTIRLPVHMVDKISKMNRAARRLSEELGRDPTDEELGAELGVSASRVAGLRMVTLRAASLDAPTSGPDSGSLSEVIEDENAEIAPEQLEEKIQFCCLKEMVQSLNPREAEILRARFGLHGGRPKTLADIGDELGIATERVRQLQNRALSKLRNLIHKLDRAQPDPQMLLPQCLQN
jgi:RNA polymerase primary sigma factor